MKKFILWRLAQFPLILVIIYLVTFLMIWVVPGSPFVGERNIEPAKLQQLREQFHADSAWGFLSHYPVRMLQGDFGPSLYQREFSVREIIANGFPVSLQLGTLALILAVIVGIAVGTISAVRRDGLLDVMGMTITLIGISVPAFVTAALLLLLFVVKLQWFVPGEWVDWGDIRTYPNAILPAVALALGPLAYIVRLQRVSMLDVLGADYVRTARAKGLGRTRVIVKHCLRNAFLPVFTYLGPAAAVTLTGSFVVETVFNLPGLGKQFVTSISNRDQTMILALVMVYSTIVLSFNLIVDIGYCFIDPRIDVTGGKS